MVSEPWLCLPNPVGCYWGIKDPDGDFVELGYGQPPGPGSPEKTRGPLTNMVRP